MTEEEKKAIEHIRNYPVNWMFLEVDEKAIKVVLTLIEKLQKENEEMKKDLNNIIDLMYFNVISKQGEVYKPIKNLRKQDVYEIYYKIQEILETRCIRRKYIVSNEEE